MSDVTSTDVSTREPWEDALRVFLSASVDGADLPTPPVAVSAEVRRVRAKRTNSKGPLVSTPA